MTRENDPEGTRSDRETAQGLRSTIIRITPWQDWETIGRQERKRELRQTVDAVFCEQVMGTLALLLIPILVLPDFFNIPPEAVSLLAILDIAIWIIFVLEYACRLAVAEDRRAFVTSPWNILNLVIVGLPAVALLAGMGYGVARYFRVLRSMQAIQVLSRGGKSVGKHLAEKPKARTGEEARGGMRVRTRSLAAPVAGIPSPWPDWQPVSIDETSTALERRGRWLDFSGLTPADIPTLSRITTIPSYTLEVKLRIHSYTRAEIHGSLTTIFLRVPRLERDKGTRSTWQFSWDGVLLVYGREGVMTFSQSDVPALDRIADAGAAEGIALSGPGILYLIVRDELSTIEDLILAAEEQLVHLEALPMNQLPSNFLAMMYTDQKVQSRVISGILHTKSALEEVSDHIQETFGKDTAEEGRLRALIDRCSLIADNAQHVSDSFSWMVDFYLNTTSFSMNRVMKVLAVLTALTMVPTIVGGLLGMNLIGNPWPATLFQMVTVVSLVMLLMAWVYYNLGWLKQD
ncbi:CorA family divalent cation transporter [uncultured Methanoregula sp.]|uniref:CorA family divalent cation transporter n=1 Tax=uncultured Methanoregula sp. TaxID=1005933 RepID=UPI002AAACFC9|nr:CorA family divalent cation transporter [uncultured Methanoregula sp.]